MEKNKAEISREIGTYLYRVRLLRNLTLLQASEAMHIHKSTLCRYEQGEIGRMSDRIADAICKTYGITRRDMESLRLPDRREGDPITSAGRRVLTEEEFLEVYRALDDAAKGKVQYLAGLQLRVATHKSL